jgi:hypothetical protein
VLNNYTLSQNKKQYYISLDFVSKPYIIYHTDNIEINIFFNLFLYNKQIDSYNFEV